MGPREDNIERERGREKEATSKRLQRNKRED